MKPLTIRVSFLFLLLALFVQLKAQFSIDAQMRNRAEFRDGYQKLAMEKSNPALLVSQRTRLSLAYSSPVLKIRISPQDVRLWGDQVRMNNGVGDNPSLDVFEAFAEVKLHSKIWLSAGRQQLVYDNRRILGDRNWNQNGISYDALIIKAKPGKFDLHAGTTWNTLTESLLENFYPETRIKSINYLWVNRKFDSNVSVSMLHVSSGVTRSDSSNTLYFKHTTGLYGEYKGELLRTWGNVYYQYGRNQKGNNVSACLIDADVSFFTGRLTPGIGISYLSGNSRLPSNSQTDKLFDVLYGNQHRYFGFMDYFRNFAKDTKQGGLADYYLWLDYRFNDRLSARNTWHYFSLAATNPTTPEQRELGTENNLIIKYKFAQWGDLEGGHCFFLPTTTLKEIQSVEKSKFSQFIYLQLTLTPSLFIHNP